MVNRDVKSHSRCCRCVVGVIDGAMFDHRPQMCRLVSLESVCHRRDTTWKLVHMDANATPS